MVTMMTSLQVEANPLCKTATVLNNIFSYDYKMINLIISFLIWTFWLSIPGQEKIETLINILICMTLHHNLQALLQPEKQVKINDIGLCKGI